MDRQIVYKVDPVYPDAARQAGTQGLVILNAVIRPDGTVKRLRPVAGPEVLSQSALDAVQSWRYTPYRAGGQAVEVETTVSVDFRLR
jgi:protein TonB